MEEIFSLRPMRTGRPVAFLFPGQGSQSVGMGRAFLAAGGVARQTFQEADDCLGWSVTQLCREGSETDLMRTERVQPALFTVSVAAERVLTAALGIEPAVCLGHSLGEFAALVVAGALSFKDGLLCVKRRGEFMAACVPENTGGMAAVLGLEREKIEQVCQDLSAEGVLVVANLNAPHQVVVSGHRRLLEEVEPRLKAAGAREVIFLRVAAPYHSPLMRPAAEQLRQVLAEIEIKPPRCPVLSNVTAEPHQNPASLRDRLVEQVTAPVRWEESVRWVVGRGIRDFIELGPGRVLTGLVRRIDRSCRVMAVDQPRAIEAAAGFLEQERCA